VDKEGSQESPKPALNETIKSEDEVVLGKFWVLFPSPKACHYAYEYEKRIDSQVIIGSSCCPRVLLDLVNEEERRSRLKGMDKIQDPEPLFN